MVDLPLVQAGSQQSLATGLLGGHAHFIHWGVLQISLANLTVIAAMIIVFALAVTLQLPYRDGRPAQSKVDSDDHA